MLTYIDRLSGFYNYVAKDDRLGPGHISIYLALFQIWNRFYFKRQISINRAEIQVLSKVGTNSYSRYLKELDEWGYIKYLPSKNPLRGSKVVMFELSKNSIEFRSTTAQGDESRRLSTVISPNHVKRTSSDLKNIKDKKEENRERSQIGSNYHEEEQSSYFPEFSTIKKERKKVATKKENVELKFQASKIPPSLAEVQGYFKSKGCEGREALKFFSYYEGNGWIAGRSAIKDWCAKADGWILKIDDYGRSKVTTRTTNGSKSRREITDEEQNYDIPL